MRKWLVENMPCVKKRFKDLISHQRMYGTIILLSVVIGIVNSVRRVGLLYIRLICYHRELYEVLAYL